MKHKIIIKILAVVIALLVSLPSQAFSLATAPASRNITARQHIEAAFKRTSIRFARYDYEKRLLAENRTSSILLACGKYLISEESETNDTRLIQNITYLDTQALMQILREKDRPRYNAIISLILSRLPRQDNSMPLDLYAEDIISRAFQFLSPIHEKIMSESDIPPEASQFISNMRPLISDNIGYFTEEFWRSDLRGEYIRNARNNGMIFYNAQSFKTFEDINSNEPAAAELAKRFLEKRKSEGITFSDAHAEMISAMICRLAMNKVHRDDDPDKVLARLFRSRNIKRILDIGCGDCSFLAAILPSAMEAGVELTGIDRDPQPMPEPVRKILEKTKIKILKGDAAEFYDEQGFDLITASGVMSFMGALPAWQLAHANMGYEIYRKSLLNAYDLAKNASALLNNNPVAAIYANSFGSILMLNKNAISEFVDIAEWNNSRRCSVDMPHADMGDKAWEENWVPLWNQAASFAVLTKKNRDNPDIRNIAGSEVAQALILAGDLINTGLNNGRIYEISYDTSRLSFAQRQLVEEYIELIKARTDKPDNIRKRPFARPRGSKEPLFHVRSTGKDFTGEGRVDIEEEDSLEKFFLKIPCMMNMALAASNIPDCSTDAELEPYLPIISYIRIQYNNITGNIMELPKIPSEIVNKLRFIPLPKPVRIDPYLLDEYNRISKDMLMSAA